MKYLIAPLFHRLTLALALGYTAYNSILAAQARLVTSITRKKIQLALQESHDKYNTNVHYSLYSI